MVWEAWVGRVTATARFLSMFSFRIQEDLVLLGSHPNIVSWCSGHPPERRAPALYEAILSFYQISLVVVVGSSPRLPQDLFLQGVTLHYPNKQ